MLKLNLILNQHYAGSIAFSLAFVAEISVTKSFCIELGNEGYGSDG